MARGREARPRLRGIGVSNYVETPISAPHERVEVTVGADRVEVAVGTQSTGQGHETTFAQVMADQLGVRPQDVTLVGGDTARIASGGGTHSDRSMRLAGTLMVDPATGAVEIVRYGSIDDAGQPINPLILHGQVHGGIVQGLGQALCEGVVYAASGQVLTGSYLDYGMPRARQFPPFTIALTGDPTAGNPLRVKGGGEAGITPALAVAMNAIMDALSELGVEHMDMPATPHRVWSAIRTAAKAR